MVKAKMESKGLSKGLQMLVDAVRDGHLPKPAGLDEAIAADLAYKEPPELKAMREEIELEKNGNCKS